MEIIKRVKVQSFRMELDIFNRTKINVKCIILGVKKPRLLTSDDASDTFIDEIFTLEFTAEEFERDSFSAMLYPSNEIEVVFRKNIPVKAKGVPSLHEYYYEEDSKNAN